MVSKADPPYVPMMSLCVAFCADIHPPLASEPREPRDHRIDGHAENQPAKPGCRQNFADRVEQVVDECQVADFHMSLLVCRIARRHAAGASADESACVRRAYLPSCRQLHF